MELSKRTTLSLFKIVHFLSISGISFYLPGASREVQAEDPIKRQFLPPTKQLFPQIGCKTIQNKPSTGLM